MKTPKNILNIIYHLIFAWLPLFIAVVRETERAIYNLDVLNQIDREYARWWESLKRYN